MKRRLAFVLLAVVTLGLTLTACQTGSVIRSLTFNGVSGLDATNGTADMSVSALDDGGNVVASGTLTQASATVTSATDNAGTPVPNGYSATANVCGNVVSTAGDVTAMLTLDATGSMSWNDPNDLRADAAKQGFIDRMAGKDEAAVSSFDTSTTATGGYLAIKVHQDLTSDKTALKTAVDAATFAGGGTNVWDAGVDSVAYFANNNVSASNKVAVLLTDGQDGSSTNSPADVIAAANAAGVRVYTIGLGGDLGTDTQNLVDIAAQTKGTFNQVQDATNLSSLFDGVFNASQGAGCLRVQFSPVPSSGHHIAGKLSVKVDGTPVSANYEVSWP